MKVRKILYIAFAALFLLTGCKKDNAQVQTQTAKGAELALITDVGTVEDDSYNEAAFDALVKYSDYKNVPYQCYYPKDFNKENYLEEIKKAVKAGAKVIVCPGTLLEEAVFEAQKDYPDVKFILVNGEPHNEDYSDMTINDNTLVIRFAEEEAGFLAGYAAVREGYRWLGFMGGMPEDSVIRYGYGFVQGADYAAIELGVKTYCAYVYADTFTEDINIKNMAANWYDHGVEVIFSCGGIMNRSVISAAEEKNKDVIGSEFVTSESSPAIIFSCFENVSGAVYDAIDSVYSEAFQGGQIKRLNVSADGVGLDMENAHFKTFSDIEYNAVYSLLKSNEIKPYDKTDISTTEELNLVNTKVVYAEY